MAAGTLNQRIRAPRLSPIQRWFAPALLLTLALHVGAYYWLHRTHFDPFSMKRFEKVVPPAFNIRSVEIDPKLLDQKDPSEKPPTKPVPDVTQIQIPGEEAKPSYEKLMETAEVAIAAPDASTTIAQEKPKVEEPKLDKVLGDGPEPLPADVKSLTDQLLTAKPKVTGSHPSFEVTGDETTSRPSAGPNVGQPNFSNLESLLSAKGPLSTKTAPILLPTDLLFDYDSSTLRPQAVGSLQKLAELIERNPHATFIIEGHTDSFGPPAYNLQLSLLRAESVKQWLAAEAAIDPNRIQTRGYGMTKLLVPGGSVEEQQLNRRVEIVIHSNRASR